MPLLNPYIVRPKRTARFMKSKGLIGNSYGLGYRDFWPYGDCLQGLGVLGSGVGAACKVLLVWSGALGCEASTLKAEALQ